MQADIIKELPKGLLSWYSWQSKAKVLYIGENTDSIAQLLYDKGLDVLCAEPERTIRKEFCQKYHCEFNYIVAVHVLEKISYPKEILAGWKGMIRETGRLLLGMENRFGLRYFCGDRDPYTGRNYDGIENYRRADMNQNGKWRGRNYARFEIEDMLSVSGWNKRKFYSVLPDLDCPQMIFSEDCVLQEEMNTRYFPMYHYPDTIFLEEETICNDLAKNRMFHQMANTYLIECSQDGVFSGARQITLSVDRGREYSFATVIYENKRVEKRAVYPEGQWHLLQLDKNMKELKKRGISVVEGKVQNDVFCMPYVEEKVALTYFRELLFHDKTLFLKELDRFRDVILSSSEIEEDRENGEVFKKGYFDLVPLNCFYVNGEFLFYDQEFCLERLPVKVLLTRMVDLLYMGEPEMEKILPREELLKRYGLLEGIRE